MPYNRLNVLLSLSPKKEKNQINSFAKSKIITNLTLPTLEYKRNHIFEVN